jgi:hypothetical protein
MTSSAQAWRAAYPALHDAFGESFVLRPRRASLDTRVNDTHDPERPTVTVTGIYIDASDRFSAPDAHDQRTDKRPGAVSGDPVIELFPAISSGIIVRRGDRLEREADGTIWRVVECKPDDEGVISAHVVKLS